MKNTASNLLN